MPARARINPKAISRLTVIMDSFRFMGEKPVFYLLEEKRMSSSHSLPLMQTAIDRPGRWHIW
jgi:hypothetical protein